MERKVLQEKCPATSDAPKSWAAHWPGGSGAAHERITRFEARERVADLVHGDLSFPCLDGLRSTILEPATSSCRTPS